MYFLQKACYKKNLIILMDVHLIYKKSFFEQISNVKKLYLNYKINNLLQMIIFFLFNNILIND